MPRDTDQRRSANGAHLARVHPKPCDLAQRPECLLDLGGLAPRVRGAGGGADADQGGAVGSPGCGGAAARGEGAPAAGGDGAGAVGGKRTDAKSVIVDELKNKPANLPQLEARTGLAKTTIWRWVSILHGAGAVHITAWSRTPNGGPYKATYTAGPGEDKPCPLTRYSEAQKSRRYQKRKRATRDENKKARAEALANADLMAKRRDPMIEALFGPARRST